MLNLKTVEASVSIAQTSSVAAVHESAIGTELPIPNVRSSVANGGKADKICSMRVLRILTRSRHHAALAKPQTNALEPDPVELRCPRLTCFHRQCARQRSARHDFTSRERQIIRIARKQLNQMTNG
jgi:hypothetical protein